VAETEIVTVVAAGKARLPRRTAGYAIDRVVELTRLIAGLLAPGSSIDQLAYRKSLEARAPASVKALANDLACYAGFVARTGGLGLPADEARVVAFVEDCEGRGLKPATVGRRLASLATVHGLLGVANPVAGPIVRDALRGFRRRFGAGQRQAGALRYGDGVGGETPKGFTLSALLEACPGNVAGLRDAALLSVGYDAGLRVSELIAIDCAHVAEQDNGSGLFVIPRSKTDQEGGGATAWLSPDTMRRIAAWRSEAGIVDGPLFRRVAVMRTQARPGRRARALSELQGNARWDLAALRPQPPKPASVTYAIGETALTPAAVRQILKRTARRAANEGLVALFGAELDAAIAGLSTHSLRVGLTQDLFATGEDAGPIAQALRWSSTVILLRPLALQHGC
jgi:hypothetical protein